MPFHIYHTRWGWLDDRLGRQSGMARATFCFCAVACEGWAVVVGNIVVIEGQWCRKGRWGKK